MKATQVIRTLLRHMDAHGLETDYSAVKDMAAALAWVEVEEHTAPQQHSPQHSPPYTHELGLSASEADALLAVLVSVSGDPDKSRRGLIDAAANRLRRQGVEWTPGDLNGCLHFEDARKVPGAAAQSAWSQLGLSTAPSRNGPCWCNYGAGHHDDTNRIEDDYHHHAHCRERRIRLRAVCELVEKANALHEEAD